MAGKSTDVAAVAVEDDVTLNGDAQHHDGVVAGPSHVEV